MKESILKTEDLLGILTGEAREAILLLCLIKVETELVYLSELVKSPECIDELMQMPIIHSNGQTIALDSKYCNAISQNFKWSEKVKASGILAGYFEGKSLEKGLLGDLWLVAGEKEKAKNCFFQAMHHYKLNQLMKPMIGVGEKLLNIGILDEKEEIEILHNLLVGYECCGELTDVIQTRHKLIEKPMVREEAIIYASIIRALAIDYAKQGNWNFYKKFREEAALIFRKNQNFQESASEYVFLALKAIDELNIVKGLEYAEEAIIDAELAAETDLTCRAIATKSYLMAMDGNYEQGQKMAGEALQLALRNNLLETAAFVYRKLAGTYEYASDFRQARLVYNEAIHFCETEKMDIQMQLCYSCLSWIFLRLGEWKKAVEVCTALVKDPTINNPSKSTAHCVIAIIKSLRGEVRNAEKHTLEGIFLAQKEQFMVMYHLLHLPMAKINELKGNQESAKEWYCKIIDEWPQTGEKHDVLLSLVDAAMFFLEQEDQVSLKKCLKIFSFISKETGNTEAMGCLAYGLGLDALLNAQPETAVNRFKEAKKHLESMHIPYQMVLVDFHLGKSLLGMGETDKGFQILRAVQNRAKKMGLSPLLLKISKEMDAKMKKDNWSQDTLTKRQLDVLQLLSDGLSNKEIADRLFLSPRTIDMHIQFIFEKFYCHTRTEAVKIGIEKGLLGKSSPLR